MIELLSPAGGREALAAAIQNGADAVYFGGSAFSARAGAENFASVADAVRYCHLRGARAYMAVNTLVREDEFDALDLTIREAYECGVDALIVQDIAVAARAKELAPGLPLHASTQAGIMGAHGALWAKAYGFERVVLARECGLEDIRAVAETGIGAEAFVHGALCVSYSGRCLFSSMIGGRSGNRGRCAQPCRLPYRMGGKEGYLLSPRDLCLIDRLPALLEAGATSFKIEGRMRRPEYVAVATRAYRRALDAALEGRPHDSASDRAELFAIFNRGEYTRGYAFGQNDAALMEHARPNHGGVYVGKIGRNRMTRLEASLHKGDSVELRPSGGGFTVEHDMQAGSARLDHGEPGDTLYRTNDTALLARARESCAQERRRMAVDARLYLIPNEPARLTLGGVTICGDIAQMPVNRPLTEADARRQIDRFGDTPLALDSFELTGEPAFLPVAALNALRREAVALWEQERLARARRYPIAKPLPSHEIAYAPQKQKPLLIVQTTKPEQISALRAIADEVYFDPSDWRFEQLDAILNEYSFPSGTRLLLPFWLEGEPLRLAVHAAAEHGLGFAAGSFAALDVLAPDFVTDAPLHTFSASGAREWERAGAARVTLSPELTLRQMEKIAARSIPCEAIIHGNLPLMNLKHCPLRVISGKKAEGREDCDLCRGKLPSLIDRKGESFPLRRVRAHDGCRVIVCNAHTLMMLDELDALRSAGLAALRVITDELETARAYASALSGAAAELSVQNRTRGHFYRGVE